MEKNIIEHINKQKQQAIECMEMFQKTREYSASIVEEYIRINNWNFNKDIRITILNQINNLIVYCMANLYFSAKHIADYSLQQNIFKIYSQNEGNMIIVQYHTSNKNSLVYDTSAIVERYFRIIAKEIDNKTNIRDKFYNIRTKVFQFLNISTETNEFNALRLLTSIRNCIHNNGIHVDENRNINYRGITYEFKRNIPHSYATYNNLNTIINDIINLVKMINSSKIILAKNSMVDDCLNPN